MPNIGDRARVYHHEYGEVDAIYSKASHVPMCGWGRADQSDPEDWDLLNPQPTAVHRDETQYG